MTLMLWVMLGLAWLLGVFMGVVLALLLVWLVMTRLSQPAAMIRAIREAQNQR